MNYSELLQTITNTVLPAILAIVLVGLSCAILISQNTLTRKNF